MAIAAADAWNGAALNVAANASADIATASRRMCDGACGGGRVGVYSVV